MTHSEMLKAAGIGEWLSKPFLNRPGFKAVRQARQMFDIARVEPPVGMPKFYDVTGGYDPSKKLVTLYNGISGSESRRHELIHGLQDNGLRKELSPLGVFGQQAVRYELPNSSFMSGLREMAAELDARIGASRNIPKAVIGLMRSAPAYSRRFQGMGRVPFEAAAIPGRVINALGALKSIVLEP